jgi:hypothetical protein
MRRAICRLPLLLILLAGAGVASAGEEALTFQDLMKFRQIRKPEIARMGDWIAYQLEPDRGDGEAVLRAVQGDTEYRLERGAGPVISADSAWAAATILPGQEERDKAAGKNGKGDKDKPKSDMALVNLADGSVDTFEHVQSFAFSRDGAWLAYQRYKEEEKDDDEESAEAAEGGEGGQEPGAEPAPEEVSEQEPAGEAKEEESEEDEKEPKEKEHLGTTLILRRLAGGEEIELPHVSGYAFAEEGGYLAYAVAGPGGEDNGLFVYTLGDEAVESRLHQEKKGRYTGLSWAKEADHLAFTASVDDEDNVPGPADLWMWQDGERKPKKLATSRKAPEGWYIPSKNELQWTRDGARLFFGFKPDEEDDSEKDEEQEKDDDAPFDPYDVEALLDRRGVDVWHWNDPRIIPNQKKRWDDEKDRTYRAVVHVESGKVVPLADLDLPDIAPSENAVAVLGSSDAPYLKEITWDGWYRDVFHVDLRDGSRQEVVRQLRNESPSLSPDGRYVAYYNDGHWHLYDSRSAETRNLTADLPVPFADEDHDYPSPAPGYGVGGWVEGDEALLVYDKYDIWQFPTDGSKPYALTAGHGRRNRMIYRVVDLNDERDYLEPDERLVLTGYHDRKKTWSFQEGRVSKPSLTPILEGEKRFRFLARAQEADLFLYTRESYREFPDLWVADPGFAEPRRLSDANPQIADYAWGEAGLVEWASADGIPLQGVLIKPGNYEEGKRYPVLVYFYRFFSQRLHQFNEPVINHRPSFPLYASNGYAVFLPDVRFEGGRPGLSAVKALVPGVQKLVDMGIADPDAIGLHGHSWSGYQAAFAITQTDIFAATVAGAPVSNMTSAYSGIRLGTGLARQFQYEQSQSRIGVSLDEGWQRYIENSPVFFARHVNTPLLIQFGDVDEAVPWEQGIELYLAMRRLAKDCIFLQYRDEPHHLKKYPNKLDYSIKMKEYFDHHLKGEPAPAWMTEGVPYRGE